MYGAPCPLVGVRGFCVSGVCVFVGYAPSCVPLPCRALKFVRIETGADWRLSRCSLVLCFSLEGTRACADARWVSGAGGVLFMS